MAETAENGILEVNSSGGGGGTVHNDGSFLAPGGNVVVTSSALPSGAATEATLLTLATQATLALIKAKTDNIDVALSTRTKPADQQHVIVDSGLITSTVTNDGTFATPARQDTGNTSLASIKTDLDTLVISNAPLNVSNAGAYVRQDSTATIAKETGGNLATVKTNTDPLVASGGGGYIRQDSTATIAKESGGNLATIATPVYTKGGTELTQSPTFSQASDNNTPVTTAATTDLIAAPSAGNHLEIFRLHVTNSSITPVLIQFIDSSPSNKFYPCYLPQYGIMSIVLGGGWHLASAKKLQMVTSAAASVYWHVDYRTVAD